MKTASWIVVVIVAIQAFGLSGCLDINAGNDNRSVCEAGDCWNTTNPRQCESRKTIACMVQSDCISDMCTASKCVNGFCIHTTIPDGSTCNGNDSSAGEFVGSCLCGVCVEPVPLQPRVPLDSCDSSEEGKITNFLLGCCYWEQCRKGEKALYPKVPGMNCVYKTESTDDFVIGRCDEFAECVP